MPVSNKEKHYLDEQHTHLLQCLEKATVCHLILQVSHQHATHIIHCWRSMAVRKFKNQAHAGYYLMHDLLTFTFIGVTCEHCVSEPKLKTFS